MQITGVDLRILRRGDSGQEFFKVLGGGGRVEVRGNFHIPTSKEENNLDGGGVAPYRPLDPPLNEGV